MDPLVLSLFFFLFYFAVSTLPCSLAPRCQHASPIYLAPSVVSHNSASAISTPCLWDELAWSGPDKGQRQPRQGGGGGEDRLGQDPAFLFIPSPFLPSPFPPMGNPWHPTFISLMIQMLPQAMPEIAAEPASIFYLLNFPLSVSLLRNTISQRSSDLHLFPFLFVCFFFLGPISNARPASSIL